MEENNRPQPQPQQSVSQFCYNLATVLDAAIIERNKELVETAMGHARDYKELLTKVLQFATKLKARQNAMGENADNVLAKYTEFFNLKDESVGDSTMIAMNEGVS